VSTVNGGKISTAEQRVDQKKYADNYDEINWKSKNGIQTKQSDREAEDRKA
jgi:hypothetical protein